jgi:hypothetical protein
MYGVPADLPLHRFLGQECNQIGIGRFQLQFHFSTAGSIYVESRWALSDSSGKVIDQSQDHAERHRYCVHKIIDSPVSRFAIDAPRSFTLYFGNGYSLTVFDDSEQFESFSIEPGNIYV